MIIILGLLVLGFLAFLTLDALGRWALLAAAKEEYIKREQAREAYDLHILNTNFKQIEDILLNHGLHPAIKWGEKVGLEQSLVISIARQMKSDGKVLASSPFDFWFEEN
jgi:hypothetical protein